MNSGLLQIRAIGHVAKGQHVTTPGRLSQVVQVHAKLNHPSWGEPLNLQHLRRASLSPL